MSIFNSSPPSPETEIPPAIDPKSLYMRLAGFMCRVCKASKMNLLIGGDNGCTYEQFEICSKINYGSEVNPLQKLEIKEP
jgi:hypothetical protein